MSFDITFDYRFDTSGFFNDPARRAALEAAAAEFENIISDDFEPLPVGLQFNILNPSDGVTQETVTLTEEVDDLIIFIGARNLSGLGLAGPDGYSAVGDIYSSRISSDFRGTGPVTDFEPWAGTVVFDPNAAWNFNLDGPVEGQDDFLSVAIHEIAHVLGFGTSPAYDALVSNATFIGANAQAVNGGNPVPLEPDGAHVQEGFLNDTVSLDPTLTVGSRNLLSDIDKAILADIGYEVAGFTAQGSQPPIATNGAETIFGSNLNDVLNGLGGNDQVQGGAGNDTIQGGAGVDSLFGQGGIDTFVLSPGDGENTAFDFDVATEVVRLVDSGFASAQAALAAVTKPFSNVSRISLSDGSFMDVFHDSQPGTPLTIANFEIATTPPDGPTEGNDALTGTANAETIAALGGDDTIAGSAGNDTINGGAGTDTATYSGNQTSYTLTLSPTTTTLTDRRPDGNDTDTLIDVEFLDFETDLFDGPFNLSVFGGPAGLSPDALESFIELYIGYFNRAPDAVGLFFWGTAFANGTTLEEMAALFGPQEETLAAYPAGTSNLEFATTVYNNVLGRTPDQAGIDFWVGLLDAGAVARDAFILEVLKGAKAAPPADASQAFIDQQLADQDYLATKTDIGAYFAVHKGMSSVPNAIQAMQLFDGTQNGANDAVTAIDGFFASAQNATTGEFLMPLVGVLDDPFSMG